ncbi:gamma-glutamyltransferase [Catenuloplanes japonicus]|uniref:gamma-glutamyltransferase n=1 Tax=Catenuloplanes japonicus TaxID=33876 RepID=UPI000527A9AB|nr:gamma-glutamyltransferase [Catenuloplanes japonicus]
MDASLLARHAVAQGTLGAVAAGSRAAAAIGVSVLHDGGSAIDAAVAAALAETVLLPPKCGPAGDLIALILPVGATAPTALIAIGPAAAGLPDAARAASWSVPATGPLSVGVPGAPRGYAALAARGRLGLAALAAPAISLASRGIVWSPICARLASEAAALLRRHQPEGTVYSPPAGPIANGERVRLPGLGAVLEELVRTDGALFDGPLGTVVADYVTDRGGVLTREDLRSAEASFVPAVAGEVEGHRVWVTPAPTYGPALLDALSSGMGASPTVLRAALDRLAAGLPPAGFPASAGNDAAGLASAGNRSADASPHGAGDGATTGTGADGAAGGGDTGAGPSAVSGTDGAGDTAAEPHRNIAVGAWHANADALAGGTSAVAAVDADGNAVVIVHSNSFPQFGSGLVVPGLDLVLSNRAGRGFTWQEGHPNAPAPGRRPRTTLHAWAIADPAGRPALLGATPGGEQQVPWNAQLLDALLAAGAPFAEDPQATDAALGDALTAARWEFTADGRISAEEQADPAQAPLPADGYGPAFSARSSHVAVRLAPPDGDGTLSAAADPRLGAAAVSA